MDRGSLFNTASFIRANLYLLAQHYQIEYADLFGKMMTALNRFEAKGYGSVDQRFITAMRMLDREQRGSVALAEPVADETERMWGQMQIMLHAGARRRLLQQESIHVEELFAALAQQDGARLAAMVRREGKAGSVRAAILRNFSEAGLRQLVQLIEPQEQAFIIDHVEHVKALSVLLDVRHVGKKMVWQVVLVYLLVERGSYFQRRQLVKNTVQLLCDVHQLDYARVLNLLMYAVEVEHPSSHRFALLAIFRDLHQQWRKQTKQEAQAQLQGSMVPPAHASSYVLPAQAALAWDVLARLRLVPAVQANDAAAQTASMADVMRLRGMVSAQVLSSKMTLVNLLRCEPARALSPAELGQMVLDWVGLAQLSRLFRMLDPQMAEFALPLLNAFMDWKAKGFLLCLNGLDFPRVIAAAILQSLQGFRQLAQGANVAPEAADHVHEVAAQSVELAAFWHRLLAALANEFAIPRQQFLYQLGSCLKEFFQVDFNAQAHRPALTAQREGGQMVLAIAACLSTASDTTPRWQAILGVMLASTEVVEAPALPQTGAEHAQFLFSGIQAYLSGTPRAIHNQAEFTLAWDLVEQIGLPAWEQYIEQCGDKEDLLLALSRQQQVPGIAAWWDEVLPERLQPAQSVIELFLGWLRNANAWHGAQAVLERHLQREFWALAFDLRKQHGTLAFFMTRLLLRLCARLPLSFHHVLQYFRSAEGVESSLLLQQVRHECEQQLGQSPSALAVDAQAALLAQAQQLAQLPAATIAGDAQVVVPWRQDRAGLYLSHARILEIIAHVLRHGYLPPWLVREEQDAGTTVLPRFDLSRFCQDASIMRPDLFYAALRALKGEPQVIERVQLILPFHCLLHAMRASHANAQANYVLLEHWHQCLENIYARPEQSPRFDAQDLCRILMRLTLQAWLRQDWSALLPARLVSGFAWTAMRELDVGHAALHAVLTPHLYRMPNLLRQALQDFFAEQSRPSQPSRLSQPVDTLPPGAALSKDASVASVIAHSDLVADAAAKNQAQRRQLMNKLQGIKRHELQAIPINVNNAGMVILQHFMMHLLRKLGLIEGDQFVSRHAQHCAVHALQYLVTGGMQTAEHHLALNKLLCGLPLYEAVPLAWEMTSDQIDICHGLLNFLLESWPDSGSSSIEGLRGNWLVRTGSLSETKDHWALIVDRRSYDVVMGTIPVSYSIIKFPWMNKALYVTWPT